MSYTWITQDADMNIVTAPPPQSLQGSPQHALPSAPSAPPAAMLPPVLPASEIPPAVPGPALVQPEIPPLNPGEGDAPPPYTTLPRSSSEASGIAWIGSAAASPPPGVGYAPKGVRLSYVDFVPRIVQKRVLKDDVFETFDTLIQRSNSWLEANPGTKIITCETVTWMGIKTKNIFSDASAYVRSMNASKSTKYIMGLRLWYFTEVFPSTQQVRSYGLQCKTFVPKRDEKMDQLLARVNERLKTERLGGRIISVETVRLSDPMPDDQYSSAHINPNRSFWKEMPDNPKRFVLCLRIYALFGETMEGYETIGYQDFSPDYNQRNQENEGYEVFSDIMQKASRWVARQQGVRFGNLQSFNVKLKKKGPMEERCVFTEHICANNRSNFLKGLNKTTHYLRIVRAYFIVFQSNSGVRQEFPPVRLTYRTFTPVQISVATNGSPAEYEGMRQLLDRINQWLQITGARVFCIETVPVRTTTGSMQVLGSEATYSQNSLPTMWNEKWLYHLRVYLDGEYVEPPGAISLVMPPSMVSRYQ